MNCAETIQLRHEYLSCLKLAEETDSKKEDLILRKEAADILEKLRKHCEHSDIVCLYSEYEGSYSYDYEDAHPEKRICLCCGDVERAYTNKFKTLVAKPIARFESVNIPDQVNNPLKYLLCESKETAIAKGYHYFG